MTPDWPAKIEAAQLQTKYEISGVLMDRVRYGDEDEDWGADRKPCHDCAVVKGQLHVVGCDAERCPTCGGQAIGCDCEYYGDEKDDTEGSAES